MDDLTAVDKDGNIKRVFYANGKPYSYTQVSKNDPIPKGISRRRMQQISEEYKQQEAERLRLQREQEAERLRIQQDAELARIKKEQEAVDNANNDIINAAIIADITSGAGKKGAQQITEQTGRTLADATKIEIPKPQPVVEDSEKVADELFGHNPKTIEETPIITPESVADDVIRPNTDDIIRPNTNDIIPPSSTFEDPFVADASEIKIETPEIPEIPEIPYEDPISTDFGEDMFGDLGGGFFG